jgi:hypothetical protein
MEHYQEMIQIVSRLNSVPVKTLADELELRLRSCASGRKSEAFQLALHGHIAEIEEQSKRGEETAPSVNLKSEKHHNRKQNSKSQRLSAARLQIAAIWVEFPNCAYKDVAERADARKIPVPWPECANWAEAQSKLEKAFKSLLFKAKQEAKQETKRGARP